MEYTLHPDERVSDEIKRIVDGKIDRAIDHIDEGDDPHETVHEVRKRCKEIRAAVRLVRPVLPTYKQENVHYRDAGRRISEIRDAHAAIETFDEHLRPAVEDREEYRDVSEWVAEAAPDEDPGSDDGDAKPYDHVPGLLRQCARTPRERPRMEVADRPLDELTFDDFQLHGYDPAPGLEFAVAE